jgi:hypothetical protein
MKIADGRFSSTSAATRWMRAIRIYRKARANAREPRDQGYKYLADFLTLAYSSI